MSQTYVLQFLAPTTLEEILSTMPPPPPPIDQLHLNFHQNIKLTHPQIQKLLLLAEQRQIK